MPKFVVAVCFPFQVSVIGIGPQGVHIYAVKLVLRGCIAWIIYSQVREKSADVIVLLACNTITGPKLQVRYCSDTFQEILLVNTPCQSYSGEVTITVCA